MLVAGAVCLYCSRLGPLHDQRRPAGARLVPRTGPSCGNFPPLLRQDTAPPHHSRHCCCWPDMHARFDDGAQYSEKAIERCPIFMKLGQDYMQDPYWCSLVGKDPWSHWRSLWTSNPSAGGETIFKHQFMMVSWFIFLETSSRQGDGVNRQCRNILVKHRLHVCANSNSILWVECRRQLYQPLHRTLGHDIDCDNLIVIIFTD